MRGLQIIPPDTKIPFMRWRNAYLIFSTILFAGSILLVIFKGLNYGIDFAGGILLDVRMPGIGGLELQKRLAAKSSKLPIIFLTAFEDPRARSEALNAGAIAFLQKPVDEQTLLEAIKVAHQGKAI